MLYYEDAKRCPFRDWVSGLQDRKVVAAIDARIARFRAGNLGTSRPIGEGASEAVINLGPGYRIYYAEDGDDLILLAGGDKRSQTADISKALEYWRILKRRKTRDHQ